MALPTLGRRSFLASAAVIPVVLRTMQAAAQCELVEVYLGYPGFQGHITGLDDAGDVACVEDLVAAVPGFVVAEEDAANQDAARALGIAGGPRDWTWENWLAIEAERDMRPRTCYSCALTASTDRRPPATTLVARDDPRLLLGGFGTTTALSRLITEHNLPMRGFGAFLQYDHDLRALAGMLAPGYWNAPQLVGGYDTIVQGIAEGQWFDFDPLLSNLVNQGGYAPTPPSAPPDDQVFMVMLAIPLLSRLLTPFAADPFVRSCENIASYWLGEAKLRNPSTTLPFAEHFREALDKLGYST